MTIDVTAVIDALAATTGPVVPASVQAVSGGSINRSYRFAVRGGTHYFLKLNTPDSAAMFEAERDGLAELAGAHAVRVPRVYDCGVIANAAYLLLEAIEFGVASGTASARLGERLADLHRVTGDAFGWHRDNTIGITPQANAATGNWIEFWRERRLGFQLELAARNGLPGPVLARGRLLLDRLDEFFVGYVPLPSLLHGDLWGGNWGVAAGDEPVIFDPAVYYGDRETDIAMTLLFGGFGAAFRGAYEAAWPLDAGFARRADLYNLYHVLNHFNLFGGHYETQAAAMIGRLLA